MKLFLSLLVKHRQMKKFLLKRIPCFLKNISIKFNQPRIPANQLKKIICHSLLLIERKKTLIVKMVLCIIDDKSYKFKF